LETYGLVCSQRLPSAAEIQAIGQLFFDTIDRQIVSDVGVGTCLSGGIDSASIVCTIKKLYPTGATSTGARVRTFSAVFPGSRIDESEYISVICEQTQSEFNWVTPTADEFWSDLQTLVKCQEEPFISPSVYAQWRVMKLAKERGLTVMLDGQGGDELLAGYSHYYPDYLMTLKRQRKFLRLTLEVFRSFQTNLPFMKAYLKNRVGGIRERTKRTSASSSYESRVRAGDLARSLEMDLTTISLPALLRYEDKNSMCHSLEARVPFLDKVFSDHVTAIPLSHKLRNGVTKYVFRLAMRRILPEKVLRRRIKIGFEIPEKQWFENDLRDRINSFFEGDLLGKAYYDLDALKRLLRKANFSESEMRRLWRTLNLELWCREFFPGPPRS